MTTRRWLSTFFLLLLTACSGPEDDEPSSAEQDKEVDGSGMMGGGDMMDDEGMMGEGMMDEGMMRDGMMDSNMMSDSMPRWMMSEGSMHGMMQDMRVIHSLLMQHEHIEREVEDIPGGVRTTTTSRNPETAEMIRRHVRQMKDRMEDGRPIRRMDPLFRELFDHHQEIQMEYEEIPGGILVIETSKNPEVVSLIRQHARAFVDEVVEHGMQRAMQPTPLPEGYRR